MKTRVVLDEADWEALEGAGVGDWRTVDAFSDIENILTGAASALCARHELPCTSPLCNMSVYDTSNGEYDDLLLKVELGELNLVSGHLGLDEFQAENETPGMPVVRHVITLLLDYRDGILDNLDEHVRSAR